MGFFNGVEVASLLAITDDKKAARLKRNIHSAFSPSGVLEYETNIDHTVSELVAHLRKAGPTTDLSPWATWFAFDTMARIAFSEDQGFMSKQEDVGGAAAAAKARFAHWNLFWTIPWLDAILYKSWFARRSKRAPSGLMRLAMRAIEDRKIKGGTGVHHDLLDLFLRCGEDDPELFTPSTITGITLTTIQAGSETTGYTTAICMYNLLRNPSALARLRAEIEAVWPAPVSDCVVPSAAIVRHLPYLEACVKESHRVCSTSNTTSERVVPHGGRAIAGVFIPGGTIVGSNTSAIYMDTSIWGVDVDVYRPERWLEANDERRVKMNRANMMFSTGKRMCLGLHISWLEMKKVIPALVMNFEVSAVWLLLATSQKTTHRRDRWNLCIQIEN